MKNISRFKTMFFLAAFASSMPVVTLAATANQAQPLVLAHYHHDYHDGYHDGDYHHGHHDDYHHHHGHHHHHGDHHHDDYHHGDYHD